MTTLDAAAAGAHTCASAGFSLETQHVAQDWREAGTTADGHRVYVPVRADVPIARAVRQWQEEESFAFNPAGDGWVSGADAGYRFGTDLAFHEAHALWAILGPSGEWQLRLSGDARSVVTECA